MMKIVKHSDNLQRSPQTQEMFAKVTGEVFFAEELSLCLSLSKHEGANDAKITDNEETNKEEEEKDNNYHNQHFLELFVF